MFQLREVTGEEDMQWEGGGQPSRGLRQGGLCGADTGRKGAAAWGPFPRCPSCGSASYGCFANGQDKVRTRRSVGVSQHAGLWVR